MTDDSINNSYITAFITVWVQYNIPSRALEPDICMHNSYLSEEDSRSIRERKKEMGQESDERRE